LVNDSRSGDDRRDRVHLVVAAQAWLRDTDAMRTRWLHAAAFAFGSWAAVGCATLLFGDEPSLRPIDGGRGNDGDALEGGGDAGDSGDAGDHVAAPGHIVFWQEANGPIFRVLAVAASQPENVSELLRSHNPGGDAADEGAFRSPAITPDGAWLGAITSAWDSSEPALYLFRSPDWLRQKVEIADLDGPTIPGILRRPVAIGPDGKLLVFEELARTGAGPPEIVWAATRTDVRGGAFQPARQLVSGGPYAILRLGGISQDAQSVVTSCAEPDAGVDQNGTPRSSALCESSLGATVDTRARMTRADLPKALAYTTLLRPTYEADGAILFDANLRPELEQPRQVLRLAKGATTPVALTPSFSDRFGACSLPGGRVATMAVISSKWMISVLKPDGTDDFMLDPGGALDHQRGLLCSQ